MRLWLVSYCQKNKNHAFHFDTDWAIQGIWVIYNPSLRFSQNNGNCKQNLGLFTHKIAAHCPSDFLVDRCEIVVKGS
jgi:hypothetical protein